MLCYAMLCLMLCYVMLGTIMYMGATVDPGLFKLVQPQINTQKIEVEQLTFEVPEDKDAVSQALEDVSTRLEELGQRVVGVQRQQDDIMKQEQSLRLEMVDDLHTEIEMIKTR